MDVDTRWQDVAATDEVDGPPWPVRVVGDGEVRVLRDGDDLVAVQPSCPHLGSPLSRAELRDGVVTCPRHFYEFDATTGENVLPGWDECRLTLHATRVVDGRVEVAW